jgi:hypothetical protein
MTIPVETLRGALSDGGQIGVDEVSTVLPTLCPGLFTGADIHVDRLNSRVFRVKSLSNGVATSVVIKRLTPALEEHGWRIHHSRDVAATPETYQAYIQRSRGEFSCAKPSCMKLQNEWVSDRTLCDMASGKPVVVQNTGPSAILPNGLEACFDFPRWKRRPMPSKP